MFIRRCNALPQIFVKLSVYFPGENVLYGDTPAVPSLFLFVLLHEPLYPQPTVVIRNNLINMYYLIKLLFNVTFFFKRWGRGGVDLLYRKLEKRCFALAQIFFRKFLKPL